jgi:hypothetical protein
MLTPDELSALAYPASTGRVTKGSSVAPIALDRRMFVAGIGLVGLGGGAVAAAGAKAPGGKTFREWLIGTWMMESFTSTDDKGEVTDAMGAGALGVIGYSADGWMSVQIMRPGRKPYALPDLDGGTPEQTIEAARSFFAYAGPFDVDEENGIVYHNLQFSMMPNWQGGRQKRYIKAIAEDVLELSGDPVLINGKTQTTRLRWKRRRG